MEFYTEIHGAQMMNFNYFGELLTYHHHEVDISAVSLNNLTTIGFFTYDMF